MHSVSVNECMCAASFLWWAIKKLLLITTKGSWHFYWLMVGGACDPMDSSFDLAAERDNML